MSFPSDPVVKNSPGCAEETWVQPLSWEDPLEKEMATHSTILVWEVPWTEEPGQRSLVGYSPWGCKSHDLVTEPPAGGEVEAVTDFIFLGSQITADGDCIRGSKRRLFLGRKAVTNRDRILKSRDITLPTKVHLVKTMVFPVVMFQCES